MCSAFFPFTLLLCSSPAAQLFCALIHVLNTVKKIVFKKLDLEEFRVGE